MYANRNKTAARTPNAARKGLLFFALYINCLLAAHHYHRWVIQLTQGIVGPTISLTTSRHQVEIHYGHYSHHYGSVYNALWQCISDAAESTNP
jgi:hypothetical protein